MPATDVYTVKALSLQTPRGETNIQQKKKMKLAFIRHRKDFVDKK